VWFWIECPLAAHRLPNAPLPPGVLSAEDLARRTGRHPAAVAQAIRSGRIPRAALDRRGVFARVSDADVRRWRAPTLEEALTVARAVAPSTPTDEQGWRAAQEVGRALGLSAGAARRRLVTAGVPTIALDVGTPFRVRRRYYVADLTTLAAPGAAVRSAGGAG
jgi:hypothetical protein